MKPATGYRLPVTALLAACASAPPAPSLAREVMISIAPETVVNDPVLEDRGAQLRTALAKAFADEGFKVVDRGGLVATTSIDYTPWTAVSAASLYIVVALKDEGVSVDQVETQKINEAFPEPAKVGDLAHTLAHALATSPRLEQFLTQK
ncbi:MAG: hypothetical protein ABR567_18245 [Myxococcales bacterium]|nr:hypothetical protein [Myxococcales bacterium]